MMSFETTIVSKMMCVETKTTNIIQKSVNFVTALLKEMRIVSQIWSACFDTA